MYLFRLTDAAGVYEVVRNVQQGLGPLIWQLMAEEAREANPPEKQGLPWQVTGRT